MDEKYASDAQSTLKNQQYLSVTCNGIPAILNRGRLGSGGKGRCIEYNDELLTPNEFQARCGKASSKDWKRSIRYHGRPISRLIDQKVLTCHAISCICAACSDDANVQSPVRYFKKWNRKRRAQAFPSVADISQVMPTQCKKPGRPSRMAANNNTNESVDTDGASRPITTSLCVDPGCIGIAADVLDAHKLKEQGAAGGLREPCKVEKSQPNGSAETMIPPLSNLHNEIVNDIVNEQKCWWHLETVAESILRDAITLKSLVSRTKETSMASKANILVQLRNAIAPSSVILPPHIVNQQLNAADESGRQDMLLRIMAMARTMASQRRGLDVAADSLRSVDDHHQQQQYCIERGPQHAFAFGAITAAGKAAALRHVVPTVVSSNNTVSPCHHHDETAKSIRDQAARGGSAQHTSPPLQLVVNPRSSEEDDCGDKAQATDHSSVDAEHSATAAASPTAS